MTAGPWVLVDDADKDVAYAVSFWNHSTQVPQVVEGTYTTCALVPGNLNFPQEPDLLYEFNGRASHLDMYGQWLNGTLANYSFAGILPTTPIIPQNIGSNTAKSSLIWSTDVPTSENLNLQLVIGQGSINIDYILITPVPDTNLAGKNLTIDDRDPYITYHGNWTQSNGPSTSLGSSFNGTTTGSTTKGDTAVIDFYGTSIGVYAVLNPTNGQLSFSYSIDQKQATPVSLYDGSQAVDGSSSSWLLNQQLLYEPLSVGLHQLAITVDEVTESQSFSLDYIIIGAIDSTKVTPPSPSASPTSNSSPGGARAEIMIPALLVLALIVVSIGTYYYRDRRAKSGRGPDARSEHELPRMNQVTPRIPSRAPLATSNNPPLTPPPPPPYAQSAPPSQTVLIQTSTLVPPISSTNSTETLITEEQPMPYDHLPSQSNSSENHHDVYESEHLLPNLHVQAPSRESREGDVHLAVGGEPSEALPPPYAS